MIRQPLIVVMGNVDSGKTSILDTIRQTSIVKSEAGAITQMISSSSISLETIKKVCKDLLKNKNLTIPGLVFIDTPGHAAFSNMRKRGGNLADLAILVININEGIKPQTIECIEILKKYKTPFIIALNKLDLITGYRSNPQLLVLQNIQNQAENVKQSIDKKLYELVGELYKNEINAERFDRVDDYTKQIAMVPCSAETREGIPELLMVLIGLAQKFLEQQLETDLNKPAKGTVLEVKEEKGLGLTIDAIIYDGKIKVNDQIVVGGLEKPIVTKVRNLFLPDKGKLQPKKEIVAAAGVKINALDVQEVIAGMPLMVANENLEEAKEKIQEEVEEVIIKTDEEGIVVKADSLGSLEAIVGMLKEAEFKIKKASVGPINKKDIADASSDENKLNRVIIGFNIKGTNYQTDLKIITHDVIYKIIDDLKAWHEEEKKKDEAKALKDITKPAKVQIIQGCLFRQSNPCVVGVEVLAGTLTQDVSLIKEDGSTGGHLKTIQKDKETVKEAKKGDEVAISIPNITGGRQIKEKDILYVDLTENEFKDLKKFKKLLSPEDIELLKEFAELKRKEKSTWGI